MIKLLDDNFVRMCNIKNVLNSDRVEEINGENTLTFEAILSPVLLSNINENSIFELDDDYFDLVYLKKDSNSDGSYIVKVEAQHISYRLNDPIYNKEYFTEEGTPSYILAQILSGTGLIVDEVEFSDLTTYSIQEKKSRRQILIEFTTYIGGELKFNNDKVSILAHRGSTDRKILTKGKHIKVASSFIDKREKDEDGNPLKSYSCEPIAIPGVSYSLGDDVLLIQPDLGINEELRLVRLSYNPYNPLDISMEFSNRIPGLEDDIYRIETQAVSKDKLMNGTRIGPVYGFEAVRNDKKARSYFRSDGMAFQSGDGTGENWIDRLYYDYDSELDETTLVFDGKFSVNALDAIRANIDVIINNTFITQNLYAEYGRIAKLSVSELDTSWKKITNYLINSTSDVNYIRIHEKYMRWITASTPGTITEQITDINGEYLYWLDNTHKGMTLVDTGLPVLVYAYVESTKFEMTFEDSEPHAVKMTFGQGYGYENPNAGKGFLYKGSDGLMVKYVQADGNVLEIKLGENGIIQSGTGVKGLRNISVSADEPILPELNDLWIDTNAEVLKRYTGTGWGSIGGSGGNVEIIDDIWGDM